MEQVKNMIFFGIMAIIFYIVIMEVDPKGKLLEFIIAMVVHLLSMVGLIYNWMKNEQK